MYENEKWFELSARSTRVEAINAPMLDMIANFGTVFIIWYGGWLVTQGSLTLGELVAFTTYLAQLSGPVRTSWRSDSNVPASIAARIRCISLW